MKKIGILIESDFYEKEIFYYQLRFAEENIEVHFLTRLWGQSFQKYEGHEYKIPLDFRESFENMDDDTLRSYSAIIFHRVMFQIDCVIRKILINCLLLVNF